MFLGTWTSFVSEKLFKVDGLDRQTELYKLKRWSVHSMTIK